MDSNLLKALIDKKIFVPGTEITAIRPGVDLSGITPIEVEEILEVNEIYVRKNGTHFIKATSIRDAHSYMIKAEQINIIDGMVPAILATIYNIKKDGSSRPVGKKRGRKAKVKVA